MPLKRILVFVAMFLTASCSVIQDFFRVQEPRMRTDIYLSSSDCALPCVYGITAGVTKYSQLKEIITSHVPQAQITDESSSFWVSGDDNTKIFITIKKALPNPTNNVLSVELSTHSEGKIISLGEMLDAGLTPQKVFLGRVSGPNAANLLIVFGDKEQIVGQIAAIDAVDSSSPITDLFLLDPENRSWLLDEVKNTRNFDQQISWLGYGSVTQYLALSH